ASPSVLALVDQLGGLGAGIADERERGLGLRQVGRAGGGGLQARQGVPAPHVDPGVVVELGQPGLAAAGEGVPNRGAERGALGDDLLGRGGVGGEAGEADHGHRVLLRASWVVRPRRTLGAGGAAGIPRRWTPGWNVGGARRTNVPATGAEPTTLLGAMSEPSAATPSEAASGRLVASKLFVPRPPPGPVPRQRPPDRP